MTNKKDIIRILNSYDGCAKYQIVEVIKISEGNAELIVFQSEDKSITSSAVVYPDGATFVLSDWQGDYPRAEEDVKEYNDWICANNNHYAVVFNGLPRLIS